MSPPPREAIIERVREALGPDRTVREVSMFGGVSFMVDEELVVAARKAGDLLVRVEPDRHAELTALPGAETARMGRRTMGPGWVTVAPDALAGDEQLRFWIDVALGRDARDP